MSKGKAVLYAFSVPMLYLAVQIAVSMAASVAAYIYIVPELDLSADPQYLFNWAATRVLELIGPYGAYITAASCAAFIGILALAFRGRTHSLWEAARLTRGADTVSVALAVTAGLALNWATVGMLNGLPIPAEWITSYEEILDPLLSGNMTAILLTTILLVPFVEELAFRGFAQRYLAYACGPWPAVVLQAILFSLFHGNWLQSSFTFLAGLMMGAIYLWTRNLWAPVAFHIMYNAAGFLLDGVLPLFLEDGAEPPMWMFAAMTAFGLTITFICARTIRGRRAARDGVN